MKDDGILFTVVALVIGFIIMLGVAIHHQDAAETARNQRDKALVQVQELRHQLETAQQTQKVPTCTEDEVLWRPEVPGTYICTNIEEFVMLQLANNGEVYDY